jgi:hypothetical protein
VGFATGVTETGTLGIGDGVVVVASRGNPSAWTGVVPNRIKTTKPPISKLAIKVRVDVLDITI